MIAAFTFSLADVICHIGAHGHDYTARCRGEFVNTSPNDYPLRGDVAFLNDYPVEVGFKLHVEGGLNNTMMARGLDEQVARWRQDGYPCDADAYVMRYWSKQQDEHAFLGITSALKEAKFARFHDFVSRHIGRADLTGRVVCTFHGFSEPHSEMPTIPTKHAFLDGQTYFVIADQTIAFGSLPR